MGKAKTLQLCRIPAALPASLTLSEAPVFRASPASLASPALWTSLFKASPHAAPHSRNQPTKHPSMPSIHAPHPPTHPTHPSSIHPSIHPCPPPTHQPINPSSIHPSHPPTQPPTYPPTHPSIHPASHPAIQPAIHPSIAWRICAGGSPCRTSLNPGGTLVEPWWDPCLVEPYLRAAPDHPGAYLGSDTKAFSCWGVKNAASALCRRCSANMSLRRLVAHTSLVEGVSNNIPGLSSDPLLKV